MKKVNKEYLLNFIIVTFLLGIIIIPISVLVFSIPFFSIIGFQSLADNLNISSLITINWYSNNMFYNIGYIALFFIVTYLIFIFLELFIIFSPPGSPNEPQKVRQPASEAPNCLITKPARETPGQK